VVFVHNQFPDFSFQFADVLIATSKRILRVALENVYFEFWHFAFAPQTTKMSDAIGERAGEGCTRTVVAPRAIASSMKARRVMGAID
jgi:hypothetical protein